MVEPASSQVCFQSSSIYVYYPPLCLQGEFYLDIIQFAAGHTIEMTIDEKLKRTIILGDKASEKGTLSKVTYNTLHIEEYLSSTKPGNHFVGIDVYGPDGKIIKKLSSIIITPEIISMQRQTRIIFDNDNIFVVKCMVTYDSSFPLQNALFSQDGAVFQRLIVPETGLEVLIIENIRNTDRITIPLPLSAIKEMEFYLSSEGRHHIWRWNKFIELYIYEEAFSKLLSHCFAYGERNLEVMGFLIGDVYKWKENEYTVVRDVVTTELDTTEVSVRFKQDAFDRLFEAMDKLAYDYLLVGWYHSHPGHRCYLSSTDIETQTRMFKSTFQTAVVMDPHNFELKAYKVKKDEKKLNSREKVVEISYAVFGIGPPKVL